MWCAALLPPSCRWQERRSRSTAGTETDRLAQVSSWALAQLTKWTPSLLLCTGHTGHPLQETALHLPLKPFICALRNAVVTFEIKRGLEVQMTVNININSRVINNRSCLPDTWLLIKQSEGAQAKPETSQLGAKASAGTPVLAGTEDTLNV